MPSPRRILIAHQGTIPHYRVRFYEVLEERRPRDWAFDVVYDTRSGASEAAGHSGAGDHRAFRFPILDAPSSSLTLAGRRLQWQHCFLRARAYDAIITDTHLANLTYPALSLHRLGGTEVHPVGPPARHEHARRRDGEARNRGVQALVGEARGPFPRIHGGGARRNSRPRATPKRASRWLTTRSTRSRSGRCTLLRRRGATPCAPRWASRAAV